MKDKSWLPRPVWAPVDGTNPGVTETPPAQSPVPSDPPADPNAPPADPAPAESQTPPADPNKPAEPSAAEPLTAEALTVPEGGELNPELTERFLGIMNNAEMSAKDRADALLGLQADAMKVASEESSALWQQTQEEWQEEVRKDPEVGGEKLDENLASVRKLIDEYGSKELEDMLDLTGMGNSVHMVRFMVKLAKAFGEGGPQLGRPSDVPRDHASILFPTHGG